MDIPRNPLRDALSSLAQEAANNELPCLVIGGNSAIHHGVPRFTRDIDLLIPESALAQWKSHLLNKGYLLIHSTEAFLQFAPPNIALPPVDFLIVNESTWGKLNADAVEIPLAGTALKTPSALHLICLKLHATRSPTRRDPATDWQDIETIAQHNKIDPTDPKTSTLLNAYGGPDASQTLSKRLAEL